MRSTSSHPQSDHSSSVTKSRFSQHRDFCELPMMPPRMGMFLPASSSLLPTEPSARSCRFGCYASFALRATCAGRATVSRVRRGDAPTSCHAPGSQVENFWRFQDPSYSLTWSARWSNVCGIVSPRALAVLRLIASSNLVGCSTGRSPGFAPRRILSVSSAACRQRSAARTVRHEATGGHEPLQTEGAGR